MHQLLIDLGDFAYHALGAQKDYRVKLACLLAFYYVAALVLIARAAEYFALSASAHIHVFAVFLIEMAIPLALTPIIIYISRRLFNEIEKTPIPSEITSA